MTHENSKIWRKWLPGPAFIVLTAIFLFACKKNNDTPASGTDPNIAAAIKAVYGNVLKGKVTVTSDAEGLWLSVDRHTILVSQLPGFDLDALSDISSATVVTSQHGLILKDLDTGKIYLLVNADPESARRFDQVAALFPQGAWKNLVYGITVVRPADS
ncbi:hypothetical protein ACFOTA_08390 [Chitinophaga sp. GCM10012297]|uniref:Uncharacterized protein n=1 Tax=Chitinophaga chungangae TaxID=2821488 RepID=A0ABS3YC37_9BACT|nr:hypothetical protein [Chitinophaga chungangae]MBO9152221.1 hypothetical protein [Chitinophaga chungangae]